VAGPWLFGALIDTGSRWSLFVGYIFGSVLMLAAAFIAARYGVAAERRSLESISRPPASAD
jgi:cyanate permease